MTSSLELAGPFLLYLALVAGSAALMCARYLPGKIAAGCAIILAAWLCYGWELGRSGVVANHSSIPPGIAILLGPVFVCILAIALSPAGRRLAIMIPLPVLVGFQAFRIGVEFTLFKLHQAGLAPRILTLEGGNFEILIALTAPIVAWLTWTNAKWRRVAFAWNVVGLLSLANVAARAVLSAPGPLNFIDADVPDVAILTYPFTFIPGFMAPLAVMLHILSLRSIAYARVRITVRPPNPWERHTR